MSEIVRRFETFVIKEKDHRKVDYLRNLYGTLADSIDKDLPDGREKAIALTHLETSCMYAIKAITHKS